MFGGRDGNLGAGGQGARGVCAANMGVGGSELSHSTGLRRGGARPISTS